MFTLALALQEVGEGDRHRGLGRLAGAMGIGHHRRGRTPGRDRGNELRRMKRSGTHLETTFPEHCTPNMSNMFPSSGFSERSTSRHSCAEDKSPFFLANTNEKVAGV